MAQLTPEQRQKAIEILKSRGVSVQKAQPVGAPPTEPNYFERALKRPESQLEAVVKAPIRALETVSEAIDPITGAPIRAAVGGAMEPGTLGQKASAAAKASGQQLRAGIQGKGVLPTTPSGEDIVYRAETGAGIPESLARPASEIAGPLVGAGLDVTTLASGIPGTQVLTQTAKLVPKAARAAKLGEKAEKAGYAVAKKLFQVGKGATQGNLDVAKSMKATKNLKATQQLFPEWSGATKMSAESLDALRQWNAKNPVAVPGSGETAAKLADALAASKDKVLNAPNIGAMSEKLRSLTRNPIEIPKPSTGAVSEVAMKDTLEEWIRQNPYDKETPKLLKQLKESNLSRYTEGVPKDLTVAQLDELLSNVDSLSWTPHGNQRAVQSLIKPEIKGTRQALTQELSKIPEGQNLLNARSFSADVLTAQKGRGKLGQMMSKVMAVPTLGASTLVNPSTYHRLVGAGRLPKQFAGWSYDKFSKFAAKNPGKVEAAFRDIALAPGRIDEGPRDIPTTYEKDDIPTVYVPKRRR